MLDRIKELQKELNQKIDDAQKQKQEDEERELEEKHLFLEKVDKFFQYIVNDPIFEDYLQTELSNQVKEYINGYTKPYVTFIFYVELDGDEFSLDFQSKGENEHDFYIYRDSFTFISEFSKTLHCIQAYRYADQFMTEYCTNNGLKCNCDKELTDANMFIRIGL